MYLCELIMAGMPLLRCTIVALGQQRVRLPCTAASSAPPSPELHPHPFPYALPLNPSQAATLNCICSMGFLNVGTQLALAGQQLPAGAAFVASAVCGGLVLYGFRRVKRLDKFEKSIKTGTRYDPNS